MQAGSGSFWSIRCHPLGDSAAVARVLPSGGKGAAAGRDRCRRLRFSAAKPSRLRRFRKTAFPSCCGCGRCTWIPGEQAPAAVDLARPSGCRAMAYRKYGSPWAPTRRGSRRTGSPETDPEYPAGRRRMVVPCPSNRSGFARARKWKCDFPVVAGWATRRRWNPPRLSGTSKLFPAVALLREFHCVYFPHPTRDRAWPTRQWPVPKRGRGSRFGVRAARSGSHGPDQLVWGREMSDILMPGCALLRASAIF